MTYDDYVEQFERPMGRNIQGLVTCACGLDFHLTVALLTSMNINEWSGTPALRCPQCGHEYTQAEPLLKTFHWVEVKS